MKTNTVRPCVVVLALFIASAALLPLRAQEIANSIAEFSGTQGQNGWYHGLREILGIDEPINYNPDTDFIPFPGGQGQGDWSLWVQAWTGEAWDLEIAGAAPWTLLAEEAAHPNADETNGEHWAIRRWVATELTAATPVAVTWHIRKENVSGGNGVTGALHLNGNRVQSAVIAGTDGVGVTNVYYASALPTDKFDLVLSPVGVDGAVNDGADGSFTWMTVEIVVDSDNDGLADVWEEIYSPGDLTKLTRTGDYDVDGLNDTAEMQRGTNPTKADTDDDGLRDGVETNTGVYVSLTNTGTSPTNPDTDNDGRLDGDEVLVLPTSDPFDPDSDDDTYLDGDEVNSGFNPADPGDNPGANPFADSNSGFSGNQGQNDWYHGYRNFTADGGGDNYAPDTGFILFAGGEGLGAWNMDTQHWTGGQWDLNTAAAGPWTELGTENTHPNTSPVHWTVRRWVANDITATTPLALRYHTRKSNAGCGNGVTAALYINGQLRDRVFVAWNDATGVTRTFFANVEPGDIIDLILSPRGPDGSDADGCDGSNNRLTINSRIPSNPRQPDGSLFIPAGSGDTDSDGIPDIWEELYFPGDLPQLSRDGDSDGDGLTDFFEYDRDTDPTKGDTDGDGLSDLVENNTGVYVSATNTGSSPKKVDTDGDGLSDSVEVNRVPPTDPNKADTDGDGFSDADEIASNTDPLDPEDSLLSQVIANSQAEFSGTQGANGWFNGYRAFDPASGTIDYNATTDFIPYPGGEGQGEWNGTSQTWTGTQWDLNTADNGPWTYQNAISIHPNGTNSPPNDFEHWAIRRWVGSELTKTTPVALVWFAKKENSANAGVTGSLHVNGAQVDSRVVPGSDTVGQVRRFYFNLKPNDIVDLALTPVGVDGDPYDWSDGSQTWLWIDLRIPPNPTQPDGTPFVPSGQVIISGSHDGAQNRFTLTWPSEPGAKYSVWASPNLVDWTAVQSGLDSGGSQTTYVDANPPPEGRYYRVSQP
ncbi:MAG: MSCRAMM family adhesin SdrC [Verrucomicrobia bacterium]|nr:MSCRAMM family adhesin SdrC [Verrucomicrobiota bacterium]